MSEETNTQPEPVQQEVVQEPALLGHDEVPCQAQTAIPESNITNTKQIDVTTKMSGHRASSAVTPSLVSSGITLALCLLPKLIQAKRNQRRRRNAAKEHTQHQQGTLTPPQVEAAQAGTESPVLKPFGSPCSTHAPTTPTANRKPLEQNQATTDEDADVNSSSDQGQQTSKQESAEALKQQLKLLMQMQEENAKLRAFMEQHLSSSQKAVTLEAENQTLKAAKQALEVELEALRKPTFELNSGEELERFKRGLPNGSGAYAAPTHAHSMCSDANGLGGAPSEGGPPSMAATDMAAGRAKQSGVMSDFVKWVRSSSSAAGPKSMSSSAVPPRPPAPPSLSRAESLRSEQRRAQTTLRAKPTTGSVKPSGSNADVTQLLEAWSGGAPTMML